MKRKRQGYKNGAWKKPFLKFLSDIPNFSLACRKAKISEVSAYAAKNNSKEFADACDVAIKIAVGKLEESTMRSARDGDEDWQWYKNKAGALVKKPLPKKKCPALAVFMLKAHAPEKY